MMLISHLQKQKQKKKENLSAYLAAHVVNLYCFAPLRFHKKKKNLTDKMKRCLYSSRTGSFFTLLMVL